MDVPARAPATGIAGTAIRVPRWFEDARGRFAETWRSEWCPGFDMSQLQGNRSDSRPGVLRGLHYHCLQFDYWQVVQGEIEVGLVDLRADSDTFLRGETLRLNAQEGWGLFIPPGVAHGFHSPRGAILTYLVNRYYTGTDEFSVLWNDPDLAVPWTCTDPILSERDSQAPRWQDIPDSDKPMTKANR